MGPFKKTTQTIVKIMNKVKILQMCFLWIKMRIILSKEAIYQQIHHLIEL